MLFHWEEICPDSHPQKDIAEALDLIPGKRSLCQIRCQILLQKCLFLIGQRDLLLWLLLVNGVLQGFGKRLSLPANIRLLSSCTLPYMRRKL